MKVISVLLSLCLAIAFIGCGVETNSSDMNTPSSNIDPSGSGDTDTDPTDTNNTDTNNTDTNTTDPADTNDTIPVEPTDYGPSTYDPQACLSTGGYVAIRDNSFDPSGFYDEVEGIKVTSYYPKTFNAVESQVMLYHHGLEADINGLLVFVFTSQYSFSFDTKWIENANRTIYIRSPDDENGDFLCFRYELNSTDRDELERVLVHSSL